MTSDGPLETRWQRRGVKGGMASLAWRGSANSASEYFDLSCTFADVFLSGFDMRAIHSVCTEYVRVMCIRVRRDMLTRCVECYSMRRVKCNLCLSDHVGTRREEKEKLGKNQEKGGEGTGQENKQ